MSKRHVLQIVQHLRPGGIETMALDFLTHASPETEVYILSLEGTREDSLATWSRLNDVSERLLFLEKGRGFSARAIFRMTSLMKRLKIDVVHTHHIGPLLYGGLAGRLAGVKTIIHTEHDAWHLINKKRRRLQAGLNQVVRPIFVADADLVAQALAQAIPTITPIVIHNGIDTEKFSPGEKTKARKVLGLPFNAQIIGCAARLEAVKGHTYLIDALTQLPSNVHLALAGNGSLETQLKAEAFTKGLKDRVHFLGAVDDMVSFHQAQDVFCLASEKEGLPLSPLEAQAADSRVVLTDVGGCREALCPDTGILVEAQSSHGISQGLANALATTNKGSPRGFVCKHRNLTETISAYEALH